LEGNAEVVDERFLNYVSNNETTPDGLKQILEEKEINEVFWNESVDITLDAWDIPDLNGNYRLGSGLEEEGTNIVTYELPLSPYAEDDGEIFVDVTYNLAPMIVGENGIM